jgi:hypothetical protein
VSYNGNYTIYPVLSMSPYHKEKIAKSEKHKICTVFCL